jgi:ankyrin repeat protein
VETCTVRLAAKLGNTDVVLRMLLENQETEPGSPVGEILLTEGLVGASEGGHVKLVQTLLERGADASRPDPYGSSALHWACSGGHAEIESLRYDGACD